MCKSVTHCDFRFSGLYSKLVIDVNCEFYVTIISLLTMYNPIKIRGLPLITYKPRAGGGGGGKPLIHFFCVLYAKRIGRGST